jgi:hypothetical protein
MFTQINFNNSNLITLLNLAFFILILLKLIKTLFFRTKLKNNYKNHFEMIETNDQKSLLLHIYINFLSNLLLVKLLFTFKNLINFKIHFEMKKIE